MAGHLVMSDISLCYALQNPAEKCRLVTRIRVASSLDREDVREINLCAFPEGEQQIVSTLAVNLLSQETSPKTISQAALEILTAFSLSSEKGSMDVIMGVGKNA